MEENFVWIISRRFANNITKFWLGKNKHDNPWIGSVQIVFFWGGGQTYSKEISRAITSFATEQKKSHKFLAEKGIKQSDPENFSESNLQKNFEKVVLSGLISMHYARKLIGVTLNAINTLRYNAQLNLIVNIISLLNIFFLSIKYIEIF